MRRIERVLDHSGVGAGRARGEPGPLVQRHVSAARGQECRRGGGDDAGADDDDDDVRGAHPLGRAAIVARPIRRIRSCASFIQGMSRGRYFFGAFATIV